MINRRDTFKLIGATALLHPLLTTAGRAETDLPTDTLRFVTGEVPSLVSAILTSAGPTVVAGKMFDGLVTYDFDFKMQPLLAESWEVSGDLRQYRFNLRSGVKWHDGQPFTSKDVAWSAMNVWKKLHPRGRATFEFLTEVQTPDDKTAIFVFEQPAPVARFAFHGTESQILPAHLYENTDVATNPHNAAPVGTGTYRFVEWERGSHIVLERNPDYWDAGSVTLNRIIFKTIPDASSRSAAFEAREVAVGVGMPVALNDARRLAELDYIELPEHGQEAYPAQAWIEFNLRKELFQDIRVRQAIAHALDRSLIHKLIWMSFGRVATGPISYELPAFHADNLPSYDYNIEKANQLLDEAGHPRDKDGVRFRITHDPMPIAEPYFRTADYFKQALKQIGIEVEVRTQDFATWIKRVYTENDFDTINALNNNMMDPSMGQMRYFWSKNIAKGTPFSNGMAYSNAEVDAALEAARVESDENKRRELFLKFQEIVAREIPRLTLVDVPWFQVQNSRVQGVDVTPYGANENLAGFKFRT